MTSVERITLSGRILITCLVLLAVPFCSYSAELINTIQIGSHLTESDSIRQYDEVLDLLPETERDLLRIEKIGRYYALRLGAFASSSEVDGLLAKVRSAYPDARTMTVYLSNNRLIKRYASADVGNTVPAVRQPQIEPSIIRVVDKLEQQQVAVTEPASLASAGAMKLEVAGGINHKVRPVAAFQKTVAMAEKIQKSGPPYLLISFVSGLTFILLGFYLRALKAIYLLPTDSRAVAEDCHVPEKVLRDTARAREENPATLGPEKIANDREVSCAEKDVSKSVETLAAAELVTEKEIICIEKEGGILITASATLVPPTVRFPETKEQSLVKERNENRVSKAVEAAILAAKSKK